MALQSRTITVGADKDVNNGGKNYVSGKVIYIKNEAGVLAPIFRDIDGLDPISQNTISNVTNAKGQFTFFIEEGNYIAEYNDQSTPLFVFGADYFNNQIDFVTNQILSNTQPYSAGNFIDGFTFTELNQYGNATVNDGGTDYTTTFWYIGGSLPHTVAPLTNPRDFPLLYQQRDFNSAEFVATKTNENAQDFIDSFALKIFQSPTDGLTEVNTRTLLGGEVYEVRKVSDNSLATIYTDKEGLNPIAQNGTNNVSGSDGVVGLFIADGDYYIEVNSIRRNFQVKMQYTAVRVINFCEGDGVVDDNQGLKDAWQAFLNFPSYNKRIDFSGGTYRLTEETLTSLFSVSNLDKLDIHFGGCEFITDHSNTSNLQNLFDLQGCNNVTADLLQLTKPTAKAETSNTLYGFLVRNSATRGGKGYWLKGVSGKNSGGIRFQGDSADYATNGINSTLRPQYGYIYSIKIDNSDMQNVSNIATEKSGYGLSCAFGGDHVSVGRLDVDRIHRAFFVYGIKDIHVLDGEIRNSDATTINIASYGTCIDVTLKARLHQDIPRSMNLVQVHGHELGVSGGASIDIENGRTHNVFDISLDLKATGAGLDGHENLVYVDKYYGDNNEGAGNDSDYYFKNISVKVNSTTTADTVFFPASNQYGALNVTTEQISLSDSLLPNGRLSASLLEKSVDSILVEDSSLLYFTPSPQPTANNDLPYTLENIHGLLSVDNPALYGSFLVVKDCVINNRSGVISASNCDPYNKIMYRTRLGGAFIEEKGRYDVYTNQNDSTKMYNPNGVENRLFGGAVNVEASVLPSISTTMNIGDGAGDFTADCYIDGVVGGNLVTVDNVKNVVVSVSEDNSSYGIFRGTLTAYGNGSDLTNLVVALQIDTVLNIGAASYLTSDITFSIDKPNRTMTFTCGNSGRYMSVAIR